MIEGKIKEELAVSISNTFQAKQKAADIAISKPGKKEFGDFATNVSFSLAKELGKTPKEVAEELASALKESPFFEKVEAVNGFLNLFLPKARYASVVRDILEQKEKYGASKLFKNQKVQIEFISANPTGPLTLGNSRGGYPGDVLANLYKKAGAEVAREYYLNNGGNQIKMLGESLLVAANLLTKEEDVYRGEYIDEWVSAHQKEINELKDDPFKLGQLASSDIVEKIIKKSVAKMGIKYDVWFEERELVEGGRVEEALKRLDEKGLLYDKDGAKWFRSTEFGDEKDRVAQKSDGLYTYFAGDSAYHWNKFAERKFDKVIDIWGADHHGDVARVMGAVEALGFGGKLQIILAQFVRLIKDGQEVRMSKRKGNYITIDDLLEMIGGPEREASDVARFFFLMRSFSTHMDFDLNLAREHSEKNPVFYVKYAYARIFGILRKAEDLKIPKADLSLLDESAELDLIDELASLTGLIESILLMGDYPVHLLTYYVKNLAKKFHAFYDKCRVIDEDNLKLTAARLELVEATRIVLRIVMEDLIGIEAPEKM